MTTPEGWEIVKKENKEFLVKTYEFKAYFKALSFVQMAGWLAQKLNHHPDIHLSFGKVVIELTTHDAGNCVTEKDRDFAKQLEQLHF
jgi:4a-hydroxytetrahydrobiopterin dehydratase